MCVLFSYSETCEANYCAAKLLLMLYYRTAELTCGSANMHLAHNESTDAHGSVVLL